MQKLPASTSRHPIVVMTTVEKKAEKKLAETLSKRTHFNMKASKATKVVETLGLDKTSASYQPSVQV